MRKDVMKFGTMASLRLAAGADGSLCGVAGHLSLDDDNDSGGGGGYRRGGGGDNRLNLAAVIDLSQSQQISANTEAAATQHLSDYLKYSPFFGSSLAGLSTTDQTGYPLQAMTAGLSTFTAGATQYTLDTTSLSLLGASLLRVFKSLGVSMQALWHDQAVLNDALRVGDKSRGKAGVTRLLAGSGENGTLAAALSGGLTAEPSKQIPTP